MTEKNKIGLESVECKDLHIFVEDEFLYYSSLSETGTGIGVCKKCNGTGIIAYKIMREDAATILELSKEIQDVEDGHGVNHHGNAQGIINILQGK